MVALKTPGGIICTREEAARTLGLTRTQINRLIRDGELQTTQLFGGLPRVLRRSVEELKSRLQAMAAGTEDHPG